MTYELPDEVRVAAVFAVRSSLLSTFGHVDAQVSTVAIEAAVPLLAAHFERVGAEKMREAAARAANESGVQGLRARNGDSIPKRQAYAAGASEVVRSIRAIPLPSQSTQRDTEEA